ncbi:hypothetical protein [Sutcliffiella rhizosphaerae]|uniref:Uncharacterized protein n=1 Tax=Sutcliffiella rhizosphaerae TaxID=2880967 RepID=A0ABM8YUL8_9BACI|nr:hypothetical protein [Sutcliffiella rhizosphaerae]CAG9623657.1 hypothetical protein BACCIP111883_04475 [Sutcliffiella rhizosphaerae]
MKKYVFNNFNECIREIALTNAFVRWEKKSYEVRDPDGIYIVNFFDENGIFLFSKKVVEHLEDKSCILDKYYNHYMKWVETK